MSPARRRRLFAMEADGSGGCAPDGRRVVAVRGSYAHAPDVVSVVRSSLARGDDVVVLLSAPGPVDLALLDALARLALSARRGGGALQVRADDPHLQQLAVLTGLGEAITLGPRSQP